ncbi:MAG: universal stress protein [Desulfovibrionaceae bacterium]
MDNKKVLIAFDGSDNAMRAVRYVLEMLPGLSGCTVILGHIERLPDRDMFATESAWTTQCGAIKAMTRLGLDKARAMLREAGFEDGALAEVFVDSCRSPFQSGQDSCSLGENIAQELMDIAQREGCGTIVVGRRGLSKAEEVVFGSVSNRLMRAAHDCALWVVV